MKGDFSLSAKQDFELLFPAPSESFFQDFRGEWDGCANGSRANNEIKCYPDFSKTSGVVGKRDTVNSNLMYSIEENIHPDKNYC